MARAVLTRDPESAAPYATALAALGLDAIPFAVTRSEPPRDPQALGRAIADDPEVIVVASARAARAVAAVLGDRTPVIWAVGDATAAALGRPARLPAEGRDATAVARAVLAAHPLPLRVLVPRAEDGRDEAIALLRAAGAEVTDVVAYRTVAITAAELAGHEPGLVALIEGTAAICVVFAPSQVTALAAIIRDTLLARQAGPIAQPLTCLATRFVAIGQTTAAALHEAGVPDVAVAATPTPAGIAKAVAAVYPNGR